MSFTTKVLNFAKTVGFGFIGLEISLPHPTLLSRSPSLMPVGPEIQDHVDKQCAKLGLQAIPVDCFLFSGAKIQDQAALKGSLTGKHSMIFMSPNLLTSPEKAKAIIHHELGHAFNQHCLKTNAVNAVFGALCFFKKTRLPGLISFIFFKAVLSNPWSRLQERQADAICADLSTINQLKEIISHLENKKINEPPQVNVWEMRFLLSCIMTHPPIQERIDFFERKIRERAS